MQTVIGRVTADAKVAELKDGRKVVNFTIAQNERFKPKGSEAPKEITTFYQCAYWIGAGIAPFLKKGVLISINGRIGVNAWKNMEGEAKAALTLHANHINLLAKPKEEVIAKVSSKTKAGKSKTTDEDLPF